MTRVKTIINPRLATPDSYTVECGGKKARFPKGKETDIGKWIESVWAEQPVPKTAYVYFNIDWDADHVLYCKYDLQLDLGEMMEWRIQQA